jgi:hypothetical protein
MLIYSRFIFLLSLYCCSLYGVTISNDHQALKYFMKNKNTYIALVWPIAQGKEQKINHVFNKYGTVHYKKQLYLNSVQALYILRNAHRDIQNIHEHFNWYFPPGILGNPARVFLFECGSDYQIRQCKYEIRALFKLQYRSIHIDDTHAQSMWLANIFFGA